MGRTLVYGLFRNILSALGTSTDRAVESHRWIRYGIRADSLDNSYAFTPCSIFFRPNLRWQNKCQVRLTRRGVATFGLSGGSYLRTTAFLIRNSSRFIRRGEFIPISQRRRYPQLCVDDCSYDNNHGSTSCRFT